MSGVPKNEVLVSCTKATNFRCSSAIDIIGTLRIILVEEERPMIKYCSLPDIRLENVRDSNACDALSKSRASLLCSRTL